MVALTWNAARKAAYEATDASVKSGFRAGVAIITAIAIGAADAKVGAQNAVKMLREGYLLHAGVNGMSGETAKKAFQRDAARAELALREMHRKALQANGSNDPKPRAGVMAQILGASMAGLSQGECRAAIEGALREMGVTDVASYYALTRPEAPEKAFDAAKEIAAVVKKVSLWSAADVSKLIAALAAEGDARRSATTAAMAAAAAAPRDETEAAAA